MNVVLCSSHAIHGDAQAFTNTRYVSPQFGPQLLVNGFGSVFGTKHNVNHILCVRVGHVPRPRRSAFTNPSAYALGYNLTHLRCSPTCQNRNRQNRERCGCAGHEESATLEQDVKPQTPEACNTRNPQPRASATAGICNTIRMQHLESGTPEACHTFSPARQGWDQIPENPERRRRATRLR